MGAVTGEQNWTDAYDDAPPGPPRDADALIADSEDQLRAIACALKPTGKAGGAVSAAAMAGLVLAGLRNAGWDVTRVEPVPFNYERSQARALEIHAATCRLPGCNYGQPVPPEMASDDSLPWPEQQRRAGLRLGWYSPCMAAVNAENRAASD